MQFIYIIPKGQKALIPAPPGSEPVQKLKSHLLLLVFFGLLDVVFAVFLLEPLYSACGIHIFLLTRIERVAHRANLCVDFFYRTASLECIAAAAVNHHLVVFWMYAFFHSYSLPKKPHLNDFGGFCNRNFPQLYRFLPPSER